MKTTRKTKYVSANLTESARNRLSRATLTLSAKAGRRIGMSAVLAAALDIAEQHSDEWSERLDTTTTTTAPED